MPSVCRPCKRMRVMRWTMGATALREPIVFTCQDTLLFLRRHSLLTSGYGPESGVTGRKNLRLPEPSMSHALSMRIEQPSFPTLEGAAALFIGVDRSRHGAVLRRSRLFGRINIT